MIFTCRVCNTRSRKEFTRGAYEKGVVLVTCDGCKNRHVIADNLGWFGKEKNVEEILQKKGESVIKISSDDGFEFSPKDEGKGSNP